MATPSMAGGGQRTPGRRRGRGPLQQSELASVFYKKRERGGQRNPLVPHKATIFTFFKSSCTYRNKVLNLSINEKT